MLVVIGIMLILSVAISYAFVGGIDIQRRTTERQNERTQLDAMERRLVELVRGAKLLSDVNDTTTYFFGLQTGDEAGMGCGRITFSTTAPGVSLSALNDQDDFETQNQKLGPTGGIAEVSLGITAVGDSGDRAGLFERLQRPSDGDPERGGFESVLAPEVDSIGFQFWDGTQWVDTWDTTAGERRLPAAVRISYTVVNGRDDEVHVVIAPIPQSDVDANNPLQNTAQ
jgi:type II secretory pathway pseudopilin PulG